MYYSPFPHFLWFIGRLLLSATRLCGRCLVFHSRLAFHSLVGCRRCQNRLFRLNSGANENRHSINDMQFAHISMNHIPFPS